ncbi:hypothetical protein [Agathobacter sp.]
MNEFKHSKTFILVWNIYLAFLTPTILLMYGIWNLESDSYLTKGMAGGLTWGLYIAFFPLVIFGINMKMDSTFTIIINCIWFVIFSKLLFYFFQEQSYAPIVYHIGVTINITALLWCIIIKVYKPLESEIYKYPWGEWMIPHYHDHKIEYLLRIFDMSASICALIFGFCVDNYEFFNNIL